MLIKEFLFENRKRISVGVEMVLHKHIISRKLIGVFRTLERFWNKVLQRENVKESDFLVHARFEMAHSQSIAKKISGKTAHLVPE
jgi:hypothetical protein